jgi:dihydrolipoamide dehydrogenase
VERDARLGGVCLNRGCIPSKALLHAAKLIDEAKESSFRGIHFESPRLDLKQMRTWKESVIEKLAGGVRTPRRNAVSR